MPVIDLTIEEYQEQFEQGDTDYLLVDVREVVEFVDGRLPGSINMPLSEFQFRMSELPDDRPLIIVCARGNRSAMAGDFLVANGYDEVYNLVDGTLKWMMRGLPTEVG